MKSKLIAGAFLASAMLAGPSMVMAQSTYTPGIDRAQDDISARIRQGLASGHITPSEAQTLYRHERDIQIRENRIKADGSASPQERQQLRQELDDLRAEVERKISNPRTLAQQPDHTPGIDNLKLRIRDRIDEGVRSGHITQREARRLNRTERDIERHEAYFKRDGVVTGQERRQLRSELRALRDDVERMMRSDRRGPNRRY